jgi:hypothetical protein
LQRDNEGLGFLLFVRRLIGQIIVVLIIEVHLVRLFLLVSPIPRCSIIVLF